MDGSNTTKIDLAGKTVTPGIIGLHQHPFSHGMQIFRRHKWLPNEPSWKTLGEVLEGIKRAVARDRPSTAACLERN